MQTLANKPTVIIGLLALIAAFAALWLFAGGGLIEAKNHKGGGGGGNAASSKAVWGTNLEGVTFTQFDTTAPCGVTGFDTFEDPNALCTPWVALFDLQDALKTSTSGGLEAALSMECSLLTDSEAVAYIGQTGSSGSRAGVEVKVMMDAPAGMLPSDPMAYHYEARPGTVVFCDRLQHLALTVPLMDAGVNHVTSTDPFIIRLFQRTKSAHAFHFYKGMSNVDLHDIQAYVRGIINCHKDGVIVPCTNADVDATQIVEGNTKVAIGKSTLVVKEYNNWSSVNALP